MLGGSGNSHAIPQKIKLGSQPEMTAIRIERLLRGLGLFSLVCFLARAILSYGMVPIAPFGRPQPNEAETLSLLAKKLSFLGGGAQSFLLGQSVLRHESVFALAYYLPILLATGVFLVLLALLARHRDSLPDTTPRLLFRWAILFGAASLLTTPVFVQDFWLSIGWGRMVLAGSNPYHNPLTIEFARGIPLDYFNLRMTYGPLWALVSAALTGIAGGNGFLAAVLFKLVLLGAWIGALRLIWEMLARYSVWRQCVGITIFGWLPLSVVETIGDGHNDIVMVFFTLLWLFSLQRGRKVWSSLALAASVLIKYTTAPLFFLDFLHARYSQKQSLVRYAPRIIAAGAMSAIVVGLFYRSRDFFHGTARMQDWHFFEPREAIISFSNLLRIPGQFRSALIWSVIILFFSITIYFAVRFVQESTEQALWHTVTAVMATIIFCIVGHLWPWFLIWVLAPAALVPGSAIARWALGVALVAPFSFSMLQFPNAGPYVVWEVTVMALYALSVGWLLLAPKKWFPQEEVSVEGTSTSLYAFES